jgi:exportin-T
VCIVEFLSERRVFSQGKQQISKMLMSWIGDHLQKNSENVNMVRPKLAQSLTLLFVEEFPHGWGSFFDELLALLPRHPMFVDMFLRVLDTIDEQVVSTDFPRTPAEIDRNGRLKDAMRQSAIPKIVSAWFGVLSSCVTSQPKLVAKTLYVMKKYVPWIDIQFFTTPQFMGMISSFLADEKFQKEAAKCIAAVTGKGMPPIDKLELIRRFGLLNMCRGARPAKGTRFAVYMAKWINELGIHILDGYAALRSTGAATPDMMQKVVGMLDSCVSLMQSCLKQLQVEASMEVIDFACRYVAFLKGIPADAVRPIDVAHLKELVQNVASVLMFAPDFQLPSELDGDEEELEEWLDQREKLAQIFRAVGRLQPDMCSTFVRSMSSAVFPNHKTEPWNKVEVILYLMICLGEVLIQEGTTEIKKQYRPFLELMLRCDVPGNPHFIVVKSCFEVMVRFFRYIPSDEQALLLIIQVTESRGIRHQHPAVRKRAMLTFYRLAQKYGHALVPVLPKLLESLQGMLRPVSTRVQDGGFFLFQMTLYESFGLLIGQNPDDSAQPLQVETVLGPVAGELRRLAEAPHAQALGMSQMQMCMMASRYVEAAGSFSKGFSGVVNRQNRTKDLFGSVFATVMVLRRKRLGDEELQAKCLQFMHRMVEVLQHDFLKSLDAIVNMLLVEGGVAGAQDFMKLMGQLINRFGARMQSFLTAILAPLTHKVFEYVSNGERELAQQAQSMAGVSVANSELFREVRELRASYYGFLSVLCKNRDLANVMMLPENAAVRDGVLKALMQGVSWWGQPREQRDVWGILLSLLELWKGAVPFRAWYLQKICPVLLQTPFSNRFLFQEAAYVAMLRMICQVQMACFSVIGDEFMNMVVSCLNSLGFDEGTKSKYLSMLTGGDRDRFVDFFLALLRKIAKSKK